MEDYLVNLRVSLTTVQTQSVLFCQNADEPFVFKTGQVFDEMFERATYQALVTVTVTISNIIKTIYHIHY